MQVSVVGGSSADDRTLALAESVGRLVGSRGGVIVCGGLGGVMEAASRGAKQSGGLTVGILPTYDASTGNPFLDIKIPSGMGHGRNLLVVASGDVVVAMPGSLGTQSEVAYALLLKRRVFGFDAWGHLQGVEVVSTIEELETRLMPIV
ncbi:MAG: TIGR00725 family protein [Deltaproteobacteria bacterium]|nr:TIGR00725 family protein [Deltaproteobacteria bacterium]